MALSIYCMGCGAPTFYTMAKPKFCSACGKTFEATAAAAPSYSPPPPVQTASPKRPVRRVELEIEDEDEPQEHVPQIDGLDVEISVAKHKGIKIGDLAFEQQMGFEPRVKESKKRINKKEFLESWRKEAGPRQGSTEIGGSE